MDQDIRPDTLQSLLDEVTELRRRLNAAGAAINGHVSGGSVRDWLDSLDWKDVEQEVLMNADYSAPVFHRWRDALVNRAP